MDEAIGGRPSITPPALIASSGPDVAVASSSSASPEPAKNLIWEREAAREREATEREERRWREMEKEEQRERQEQEDRRIREARDTEERRHQEAVEREEMRERETWERDELYLALLELIAKK